jgi:hypothetical protein
VVEMGMADQQDFGIAEAKPQLLDARPDERDRSFKTAVDENVSLRRGDQVYAQPFAPDEINVADDVVRWEWAPDSPMREWSGRTR